MGAIYPTSQSIEGEKTMEEHANPTESGTRDDDVASIIEIRDPEIDVEAIMARVRANVARRRAEGAYQEDLDAVAEEVFAEVMASQPTASLPPSEGGLTATLAELGNRWMVREVPFTSRVPVLGPVIVAARTFWNWMSTKWYVQPILQQQMGFNALVVRAFQEMDAERQALAEEVHQLRSICEQQQRDIEMLRREERDESKHEPPSTD
jgi:O-antigen chain-terminating methyltransferase